MLPMLLRLLAELHWPLASLGIADSIISAPQPPSHVLPLRAEQGCSRLGLLLPLPVLLACCGSCAPPHDARPPAPAAAAGAPAAPPVL
jgi:hypothetical protein